jgi:hypothetical protein
MFNFSFAPPDVQVRISDNFKGKIIAFGYTSLEEEQVQPPHDFKESIYNLTKRIFEETHPEKTTEILAGSTLQHISDTLTDIDYLIVPRFQSQSGFFDSDNRNYLIVRSVQDTKYQDPMIVTLDLQYTAYEDVVAFITKIANQIDRYEK